jgi:hypothetical protein
MSLQFDQSQRRYHPRSRSVQVSATDGINEIEVLIPRDAIEFLTGAENLSKEESLAAVMRCKDRLEEAAANALARNGAGATTLVIEMHDVRGAGDSGLARSTRPVWPR